MKRRSLYPAITGAGFMPCKGLLRTFAIVFFILSGIISSTNAQVTLLTENFGTGTTFPSGWTASGTNWANGSANPSSGYTGASGGANAEFTNNNTVTQTLTYNNNLSTVGYNNITVLWGSRIVNTFLISATITVTLSWSADGTTWNNVTYTNNTALSWALVNGGTRIALPAGAEGVSNLRLRLTATASAGGSILGYAIYKVDDFTVMGCPASAGTISYTGGPFCTTNTAAQTVTRNGISGGVYSAAAGLSINASTGAITPSASTPGTYTVTYTVTTGSCVVSTTTSVTIAAAPSSTIAYTGSPYCSNAGTANVTRTGTAGGTYSSTAGLSINSSTGTINLAASTAGTYTVTYTIAASSGCTAVSTTTSITITAAPAATISYAGTPYCSSAGVAAVTLTGTTGGTYSSSAGLSINASTGAITPSTSTPGTYTVTYTVAASGGCSSFGTTTSVTITAAPAATISYSGSPFCTSSGAVAVSRTGTTGGTFSSTTGLIINASTGAINPSGSTAGTYTVTYTIAASGGCPVFTTTTSITITAAPSATISYSGNTFCSNGGIINVIRTGTAGGTFSSTTGLVLNASTGAVNTSSSIPGTYTITYTIAAGNGCSQYQTTTSIAIQTAGIWTGASSTDYNTAANWSCGGVPTAATNIVVPSGLTNYPIVSGNNAANNISIASGASLIVNGGTLQIAGTITNNGKFSSVNGTTAFTGTTAQQINAGLFDSAFVKNLTISNSSNVTLATTLNLTGILKITAGQFNTGDNLILKSSATATAMVDAITSAASTPINGKVTVERYFPGRRRYRLITSSVTTSTAGTLTAGQENLSIWGAWQNSGGNTTANTGTFITGGNSADGFDTQTTNASLFTYDDVNRKFIGFTSTNGKNTKYTPLKAGIPYYMFVYGDRTNSITTSSPNNTVLKTTGTLLTGDQLYTTSSAIPLTGVTGRFTFLGNPFAAAINWATIPKTNLQNTYWGWDPNLSSTGGYVTVLNTGTVTLQAPFSGTTGLNQYIQPGQGFFVRTSGNSPTLTIREQDKVNNFNSNAFRVNGEADEPSLLAINLQYVSGANTILTDGVLAAFGASFTTAASDEDAVKIANTAESMSIVNDIENLSIDARPLPRNNDTLFLNIARLTRPQYTLQIFAQRLSTSGLQVYLQDRYLNTLQPLSLTDTNNIVINTNLTIPASVDANRFRILLRPTPVILPLHFTSVTATVQSKQVQVNWRVADENEVQKYEIEKSTDGVAFSKAGEQPAKQINGIVNYQWTDASLANGTTYYRIKAVQHDGKWTLSQTVAAKVTNANSSIVVVPNPVTNGQINIKGNAIEKGNYLLQILNLQGQIIWQQNIVHNGGMLSKTVLLDKKTSSGTYYLKIFSNTLTYIQAIFVE